MTDSTTTIAIAGDHAAVALKQALAEVISAKGLTVLDLGTNSKESVDYPDFADAVANAIHDGKADRGLLVCGSGIGISIAANRYRHIRAALCTSEEMAKLSRQHNDANVLALGARITDLETAKACLTTFLETEYEGGRHQRRIDKMS